LSQAPSENADKAELSPVAARVRKRFEDAKKRLAKLAEQEGLLAELRNEDA
jgi:hypothetical protein